MILETFLTTPFDARLIGNLWCCELLDPSYVIRGSTLGRSNRLIEKYNQIFSRNKRVEIETDNKEAACIVNRSSNILASSALVQAIWTSLQQDWLVQVRYVPREVNEVADKLAAMGRG
ncbi:hypothetical protein V6N11_027060 [Hibiscus sabdariffa]|uniref:RNase H type-1 domain-containing protein n=1 Tax=Hibiscus sabdariffa TaxID=183260 RepID=A0ABR2PG76_9ROSI